MNLSAGRSLARNHVAEPDLIPMPQLTARALLFDLDGVLVDSIDNVELVWRDWANEHGFDADAIIKVVHGRRAADTVAAVAPELDLESEVAKLSARESTDARELRRISGASELIAKLPKTQWAVVTSGTRAVATFRLEVGGIPMPTTMIAAEDVTQGKPNPEGYLKAASLLGFAPSDCVVIEDAPAGLGAARAAGMNSVGVASTYDTSALSEATMVVLRLADLVAHVDETSGIITLTS